MQGQGVLGAQFSPVSPAVLFMQFARTLRGFMSKKRADGGDVAASVLPDPVTTGKLLPSVNVRVNSTVITGLVDSGCSKCLIFRGFMETMESGAKGHCDNKRSKAGLPGGWSHRDQSEWNFGVYRGISGPI